MDEKSSQGSRMLIFAGILSTFIILGYAIFEVPVAFLGFKNSKDESAEGFVYISSPETKAANESQTVAESQNRTEKNYSNDKGSALKASEGSTAAAKASERKPEISFPININTASASELTALDGIGEVKAQAIVDYRRENGAFSSKKDITSVKGIGEKTYEKIKDKITV